MHKYIAGVGDERRGRGGGADICVGIGGGIQD